MKFKKNWLIPLILTAAAGAAVLQNNLAPASPATLTEAATGATAAASVVSASAPAYDGCAYTWAYHDAPDLTEKFSNLLKDLNPGAKAHASLYGENCVYADGHADFHVMETDFYVRLPVEDMASEKIFGDWMAQVMELIVQIPRAEMPGNYGFVEFSFEKSEASHTVIKIPIQRYLDEAQGKSGLELYMMFTIIPY